MVTSSTTDPLWVPVDDAIEKIHKTLPAKEQTILILGAGMAGLGAAHELIQNPLVKHVHIVEGRKHGGGTVGVGGRIRTHRFGSGEDDQRPYAELGAMRIPETTHDYTWHYICKLGLKTRQFVNHVTGGYEVRGQCIRNPDQEGWRTLAKLFELEGEEKEAVHEGGPGELLKRAMKPLLEGLTPIDRKHLINGKFRCCDCTKKPCLSRPKLHWLDSQTIIGHLMEGIPEGHWACQTKPLSRQARDLLSATTALESRWHWSLAAELRASLTNTPQGPKHDPDRKLLFEVEGGLDLLPRGLHERLMKSEKVTFHFETKVTSLGVDKRGDVTVGLERGGSSVPPPPFDRVICTLPFPVLRQLDLHGLSHDKIRAIRHLQLCSSTKVLLLCKSRFWEKEGIYGGSAGTDRASRQAYYPSDFQAGELYQGCLPEPALEAQPIRALSGGATADYWNADAPVGRAEPRARFASSAGSERQGVLLGSYTWSAAARMMGRLPREEDSPALAQGTKAATAPPSRREQVIADLSHLHEGLGDEVINSMSIDWDGYEWSKGAFGMTPPGDLVDYYEDGREPEGKLFFAGEHISIAPGWIQGALESGLAAALKLLEQAAGKKTDAPSTEELAAKNK